MARRTIRQYNLGRQLVKEYNSIAELRRSMSLDSTSLNYIRQCCERGCDMAFGYIWRYADDDEFLGVVFADREQWVEIPYVRGKGIHGYYVSSFGKVARYINGKQGILSSCGVDENGNPMVRIMDMQGWYTDVPICLLVANAFVTNTVMSHSVRHKDGNPMNNRYDNLEWV